MDFPRRLDQPTFQEVPEEITENRDWSVLVGGMGEERDAAAIARAYKLAGDTLVLEILRNKQGYEIAYPIFLCIAMRLSCTQSWLCSHRSGTMR